MNANTNSKFDLKVFSKTVGWSYRESLPDNLNPQLSAGIPIQFMKRYGIVPICNQNDEFIVAAISKPKQLDALDVLADYYELPIEIVIMPNDLVADLIQQLAENRRASSQKLLQDSLENESIHQVLDQIQDVLITDSDHPFIIRFTNSMLAEAIESGASDIHLEPDRTGMRIRFRIDGMMQDRANASSHTSELIASRIKVMAKMDVSNRIHPQDGSLTITVGKSPRDLRISSVPTPFGERVVIRILGRAEQHTDLLKLGMSDEMVEKIDTILSQNEGFLLVAGPTGSGKTTTLYAALHRIDCNTRNTMTIEDPVEYHVPGVSHVEVGQNRNISFGDGLRSILRQDPDIIMVGEIRDGDTAGTALRAALTGHMILSTIHTHDPAGAVIRLLDLGVDAALIAETLTAVIDQRLIRLLCPHCKQLIDDQNHYSPAGCIHCDHTGYKGRRALFRFIGIDQSLRSAIRNRDHDKIEQLVTCHCDEQLKKHANLLIEKGLTSLSESQRILQG